MQGPPGDPRFANPSYGQPLAHPPGPRPQASYGQQPQASAYGSLPPPPYGAGSPQAQRAVQPLKVAQPSGLPAPLAFGLALAAVVVALIFDVIFLKVTIPGVGGYAWYLTTALSFAGAGYAGIKWTRASKTVVTTALVLAGVLYGAADLGLEMFIEELNFGSAVFLAVQGLVIAIVTGGGGMARAAREMADD